MRFFKGLDGISLWFAQNDWPAHVDRQQIYLAWCVFAVSMGRIASKSLLSATALCADVSMSLNCLDIASSSISAAIALRFKRGPQLFHFHGEIAGVLIGATQPLAGLVA